MSDDSLGKRIPERLRREIYSARCTMGVTDHVQRFPGQHRVSDRSVSGFINLIILAMMLAAGSVSVVAKTNSPVLVSEQNSTRAIALDAVTFKREPFPPTSLYTWGQGNQTRVMIFCLNLALQPGEDVSAFTADAEDAAHKHYQLKVEYFGNVPSQAWLSAVILRLSDDLTDVGDVLVRLSHSSAASNRVRIGIGHVGGGPPDDQNAMPTPAPPYSISGRITEAGNGLSGVQLTVGGTQNGQATTDKDGFYSFTVTAFGDYTVTPSKIFYDFAPQSFVFSNVSNSQTGVSCNATRQTFTVGGQVTDENSQGLNGINVTLADLTKGTTITTNTSNGGNYSFANVAAGFNYTVAPANNSIFTFAPQSLITLSGNVASSVIGVRRTYNIVGQVTDATHQGVAGVTVTLGSAQTSTTDTSGNYSFTGIPAGFSYSITPSRMHYIFSPPLQTLNNLDSPQTVNFDGALRKYAIAGRVTDGSGQGLFGMTVTLSGSETGTTVTDGVGNYSFSGTALGSYSITPSVEQDFYNFSPVSQQLNSLSDDQTASFTGTLSPITNPFEVLEFDGSPKSVDYGYFWPPHLNLGHFFWEFWAMPGNNAGATYLLSDGYGGAHALLFGFGFYGGSEPERYQLFGDTFDGVPDVTHITFFSSDQGPAIGEWGHFAVGWDGQNIITYYNGVPAGKTAFAGPRQSPDFAGGGGRLLIGGSDHNNLVGRIAQVRGYEGSNPREVTTSGESGVEASFAPQTIFGVGGNLLSYYFRPAQKVADLSFGYESYKHVGVPRGTTAGILYDCGNCPPPQFVIDPSAPNFPTGTPPSPVNVAPPSPVPAGARIFDSFGRLNSTYLFGAKGGLGSTESGAAGPQLWHMDHDSLQRQPFGILNGIAVLLGDNTSVAWVSTASSTANLDVEVSRRPGIWGSGISTGLSFRAADNQNYFFAYARGDSATNQVLTVGYYQNGQRTNLTTSVSMPSSWVTLIVVTNNSGSIKVYADSVLVYSVSTGVMATATGAGLYNNSSGLALVNRWDNFTVYDAQ